MYRYRIVKDGNGAWVSLRSASDMADLESPAGSQSTVTKSRGRGKLFALFGALSICWLCALIWMMCALIPVFALRWLHVPLNRVCVVQAGMTCIMT